MQVAELLIIEDDVHDVELVGRALERIGIDHHVVILDDGAKALAYLTDERRELPALVLLDLGLPKVDGIDVLYEIRHTARLAELPVIVLTGSDDARDLVQSYHHGATRFVQKTSSMWALAEAVVALVP